MTKLTINSNVRNDIFNRSELKGFVDANVVPSKAETISMIAKEMKVDEGVVKLLRVKGKFGTQQFNFEAEVYDSVEDLNKMKLNKKKKEEKK